ncbi:hypothetical protein Acr_14g0005960 [Actinidia rufa]|uniref:SWIM-type domain-containing protein n=1 Tax=Actinidia rufa TaxID=165716 RepID=A0A7J0FQN6_9ERIC|nr:hypothetical protein Acr_14g0005960 [Actinidia rufa]
MNTSGSHTVVCWTDVHTYGELLSGRGDLSILGSFTQMLALGQSSSRSTLVEEAPGQQMCSLFSQGECIEAGGASGSMDPVERLVALGETGTQDNEVADVFQSDNSDEDIDVLLTNEANDDFDDDGREDLNVGEALHDNSHIPFFTNLVGADDVVGGRDLYDGCPTWSDVTPEFAKGMVFKDKNAVIRACNWYHVKNNKHYHVVETNKNIWSTRCSHDCPWKLRACLKKQHGFFEIKQYPGPHTCLHGMKSLDHRNINSTFIAHLIKTQVVERIQNRRLERIVLLCNEDPRKWTLAHDGGYRWGVTTTNDSECYNNVLRGARDLPITSCVEVTFYRLVATFNDKRRQIESALVKGLRYTFKVQAKLEEYQARSAGHHVTICNWASGSAEVVTSAAGTTGNNKHAIYLNPPSCDCGKWMIYHYPCSHMLAVCAKSGRQPWHLIDPKYKLDVYAHVYNTSFEPMVHKHYWAAYDVGVHTGRVGSGMRQTQTRPDHPRFQKFGPRTDPTVLVTRTDPNRSVPVRFCQGLLMAPYLHYKLTTDPPGYGSMGYGTDALACRCYGSGLYDRELDPRVLQYVLRAGFYGVYRLGPIRLDHALITAFVERWRPETHTFHLPVGEASITLQDVAILLGLPIDGAPITHTQTFVTVQECQDICMQAFGVIPPAEEIDSGRLRMSWLRRTFDILPEHADDVSVQRHVRAYILQLIGGLLLTNYSQTLVRVAYLPLLLDLDAAGACSWGSAVLAMLYRSMCRATKTGQRQIAGALLLLQRFPRMCPHRVEDHTAGQQPLLIGGMHFPGGPWGARWRSRFRTTTISTHVVRVYRDQLDRLRPDKFTWRSYDGIMHELPDYCRVASDIWVSRSPLVCFEVVEWHLPDRVCRQFGLRHVVPVAVDTSPALHGIDMRGRTHTDWTQFHREHIDHWHHRREYLVVGVIDAAAMRYDDPYMIGYRRITRTLVGNPAHRPTSAYVEIGSTIEIETRYIAAIHDRIDRAIYSYDRPESLQDMYDARDMCSRSLHASREHERIGQPEVPEPPLTMPPGVPATSPAMPPAFPVHPPPSTSSSQQFTQYVGATQTAASYVTPTMPSYTYHILSHDVPSSSRPSSFGVRPRHTTHRHITSPVTYDQGSSYLPVGDEEEFDGYVNPLLASTGQIEIHVSVEGVSQITQAESQRPLEPELEPEPQSQPHRLGTLTHVFSRRLRPSRDRRPPRCGTGGHV